MLTDGSAVRALLGTLGLTLIGTLSLWRAYRATLRTYTGRDTAGDRTAAAGKPTTVRPDPARVRLVERRVPRASEHASAVAAAGLRACVLAPVPRRDLLLGKNLTAAPLVLGLALLGSALIGAVNPMRAAHYPAVAAQLVSTYLIACVLFTVPAILAPVPLAPGSARPAGVKLGRYCCRWW